MKKDELLEKVKGKNFTNEQLVGWVNALPTSEGRLKPTEYKSGDVIMSLVFKHPYILLKKRKTDWVCGLLTSEENCPEILEACQSRFFPNAYITKALFTTTEVKGSFMSVYGNNAHLISVFKKLKEILK